MERHLTGAGHIGTQCQSLFSGEVFQTTSAQTWNIPATKVGSISVDSGDIFRDLQRGWEWTVEGSKPLFIITFAMGARTTQYIRSMFMHSTCHSTIRGAIYADLTSTPTWSVGCVYKPHQSLIDLGGYSCQAAVSGYRFAPFDEEWFVGLGSQPRYYRVHTTTTVMRGRYCHYSHHASPKSPVSVVPYTLPRQVHIP